MVTHFLVMPLHFPTSLRTIFLDLAVVASFAKQPAGL
jgi:hypothetical protein